MSTKNIGIDCRFWGTKHAGLGRYTRNLVLEIIKQSSPDLNFTLFFQKNDWQQDKKLLENCKIVDLEIPHYSLKEQTKLPKIIDSNNLDLIHYPHFNYPILAKTPFVVTIHDLIKHFFKGKGVTTRSLPVYFAKHLAYRFTISKAAQNSQTIITPSVFTKDQIVSNLDIDDGKIITTYEGVSSPYNFLRHSDPANAGEESRPNKFKSIQKKYKIQKPYFVYTGSAYPSKNIPTLLKALKILNKTNKSQLLIACARNIFWEKLKKQVKEFGLEKQVKLPGKVSDEDLIALYQNSTAFVMPSLMEGFGLPALEAMSAGCPIISSETGSLPEIYGKHAFYFNPADEKQLALLMQKTINLTEHEKEKIIKSGQKYAQSYSWQKAAKQTLKIYKANI